VFPNYREGSVRTTRTGANLIKDLFLLTFSIPKNLSLPSSRMSSASCSSFNSGVAGATAAAFCLFGALPWPKIEVKRKVCRSAQLPEGLSVAFFDMIELIRPSQSREQEAGC
jgi:hypothetical protein